MATEIRVPDIGDFSDVDVIEVLVSAGDTIAIDDPLITLESDKASMDVPASQGSVVQEVKVAVGDRVSEGSLILVFAKSDEASLNVAADDAQPDWAKFGPIKTVPMSRINRLSAAHLHKAWLNVPQVTHFDEADITELEAYRQKMKAKEMGFGLRPLVFMMRAVVAALKEYPKFNSAMDDDHENLIQREYYNLGIAVDTPDGLMVPVVREVDRKGVFQLARELGETSQKAREGQLKATDLQGGCFSISSLGGIGGTNFTPIVNAPEVGILGPTRARLRLMRVDGEIVDRLIQPLAVSYDHRVIDGAYAARFVSYLAFTLSDVRNLIL